MSEGAARPPRSSVFVIGAGRLGRTLALACTEAALPLLGCWNRTPARARSTRRLLATRCHSGALPKRIREADLVLLTVTDEAIGPTAERLARTGLAHPGQLIVHCAGALGLSPLAACAAAGAGTASLHPLRAFSDPQQDLSRLPGTLAVIESAPADRDRLSGLARALKLEPALLGGDPDDRSRYHAAAVSMAGNLCALFDTALELVDAAGLPESAARAGLLSLARGVLDSLERTGSPAASLTGPVARGDEAVIRRHRKAMAELSPDLRVIYDALIMRARHLRR